jgi:predicted RND superfamily exporter protein
MALSTELGQIEGVFTVIFDDTPDHYRDACALYDINLTAKTNDEVCLNAMEQIGQKLEGYDVSIYTDVGYDENAMLDDEMTVIGIVAVIIVLIVMTLTSRSYAEIPVLLMTFGGAALLNMGTNFLCGKISFISDSVAVVLQLALAIDYAIILCHRYSDERETMSIEQAAIAALSKAIPEIGASSLTTISGLAALGFMKFGVGLDMAIVLMKSIFMSLMCVFTLMPGLLVLFGPLMDKTRHKKLLPNMEFLGKFAVKTRRVIPVLFVLLLGGAFWLSNKCPFAYSFNDLRTAKMTERQEAYFEIKETFGTNNLAAVLVPVGDYEAESALIAELEQFPEVKSVMGLANTELMNGLTLASALTPRELSELLDMDYEVTQLLYTYYAASQNQYGQIINDIAEYKVPLFDMILFLKDEMEKMNINLEMDGMDMSEMFGMLEMAKNQLQSEEYSRIVVYLNLEEEGEETYAFLSTMRDVLGKYYEGDFYVVGNSTSSRDLAASFDTDNLVISLLSSFFVVVVLLFTFKSAGLPALLIIVIQGAIWINFSFPTLTHTPMYFLGYLIVQAIQMGANIDYAIVISSHYQEKKQYMPHKEAILKAVNAAFPTVFTSGIMMASAGLLIGNLSAQPVVSIMGTALGRGTIVTIILVLFVLPATLVLGDSIINRTTFKMKGIEIPTREASGTMRVQGHLRGYVSGYVDADISGIVHGQLNAAVSTDTKIEQEGEENE